MHGKVFLPLWVAIAGLWIGCVCKGITYALSCMGR